MATAADIPTDLTIEIGENLAPDRFLAAARAFFGYVQEIAEAVTPEGERVQWIVRIKEGSHLLGVETMSSTLGPPPGVLARIYDSAERGIQKLAAGDLEEAGLPAGALKHLRVLSEMTDGSHGKPVPVRVWVRKKPINVNPDVGQTIREDSLAAYQDYGTLEGRLRTIQDQGGLQLQLRDEMLGTKLVCHVPEPLLPEAFANFRKRVEVTGLIHYRRNGQPISIQVEKIEPLPEDEDLPSPEQVRGLLRAAG